MAEPKPGDLARVPGRGRAELLQEEGQGAWRVLLDKGGKATVPLAELALLGPVPGGARQVLDPEAEAKPEGWTRFVCFSDTHGRTKRMDPAHVVAADVMLHAGDFTDTGGLGQVQDFAEWLRDYPAAHKVVIAGNHDITFQPDFYEENCKRFHGGKLCDCSEVRRALIESGACHYLEDQGVEILGYQIYGSPWQPEFCDWAFNLPHGAPLKEKWDMIPETVDVLLTHGPCFRRKDHCIHGAHVGCPELTRAVEARQVPVSVSGHIHEAYGVVADGVTLFVNASTCTLQYRPNNPPIVLDLPPAPELRAATRAAAAALAEQR